MLSQVEDIIQDKGPPQRVGLEQVGLFTLKCDRATWPSLQIDSRIEAFLAL